jgi:hypothetical protein
MSRNPVDASTAAVFTSGDLTSEVRVPVTVVPISTVMGLSMVRVNPARLLVGSVM